MGQKICGVTGHREIPAEYMEQAEQDLRREIEKAIADGYTYFISGFADGADQLFARIVLEKAKENPSFQRKDGFPWQPKKDSNPHKQSQSLSCYLYTIRLCPVRL